MKSNGKRLKSVLSSQALAVAEAFIAFGFFLLLGRQFLIRSYSPDTVSLHRHQGYEEQLNGSSNEIAISDYMETEKEEVSDDQDYKYEETNTPDKDTRDMVCADLKVLDTPTLDPPTSFYYEINKNTTPEGCKSGVFPGATAISSDDFQGRVRYPGLYPPGTEGIFCNRSDWRTDVCAAIGETVTLAGKSKSVILNTRNRTLHAFEERVRPYTRKFEQDLMQTTIQELKLNTQTTPIPNLLSQRLEIETCQVHHHVPGVVFSTGGYTGNFYHDINDGLVPLFITTQHLKGEVVLAIVDQREWWRSKYREILKQLTNHEIIDLDKDNTIHCFPEITVGLFIHGEVAVNSSLMPNNESLRDFRTMIERAFQSDKPMNEIASNKPQLVILVREKTRRILNIEGLASLGRLVGFRVRVWETMASTDLKETFRVLNGSDVVMGVHGAGLTHFVFMRPGAVLVQIIPFGLEWPAGVFYEEPATRLGVQYVGYKVGLGESSLRDKYGENDTELKDPGAVYKKGWWAVKEAYLDDQDVTVDLSRMIGMLRDAKRRALRFKGLVGDGFGGSHGRR